MLSLQLSLSRKNFGDDGVGPEDINERPLRKLIVIQEFTDEFDPIKPWHLEFVFLPTFNQVAQKDQIIIFGLATFRLGQKSFDSSPGSIKVLGITNRARWKRIHESPIFDVIRTTARCLSY